MGSAIFYLNQSVGESVQVKLFRLSITPPFNRGSSIPFLSPNIRNGTPIETLNIDVLNPFVGVGISTEYKLEYQSGGDAISLDTFNDVTINKITYRIYRISAGIKYIITTG